jgi:transposase-like protein
MREHVFVINGDSAPKVRTRELVAELLERGLSSIEVARALGISKSTVCYHKRRLGHEIDAKFNRRYDWAEYSATTTAATRSRSARFSLDLLARRSWTPRSAETLPPGPTLRH